MKSTVTEDAAGLRFEIKDDGSEDFCKAVQFTCVNNPLRLTPEQRLAIDWAASVAREQSQIAIHKTLRAMLGSER
jgi:hypothetical protein